jgi:hypothetical protein
MHIRAIIREVSCITILMFLVVFPAQGQTAISFVDATEGSGINRELGGIGVSTVDFNGDGYDDLTIALRDAPPAILQNNGDATFTDVAAQFGITSSGNQIAAVWVDVNRDALPDLFLGHQAIGRNALWLNQGDGSFDDVAEDWGINTRARVGAVSFTDFSGDGYPDLFMGVENGFDLLYLNTSGTGFEDVTEDFGVAGEAFSIPMQATWIDVDEDGDRDLFVTHDEFVPNFLYFNEGGTALVDRAASWGIRDVGEGNSMGVAWGDPDMDGDFDAYVTRIGVAGLYVFDQRIDRFVDQATQWRVTLNGVGWGTYFVDLDNDMDEDLPLVHSSSSGFPTPSLFENQRTWYEPIYEAGAFRFERSDMGLATGDFDADGRQDLIVINTRGFHRLLLNNTPDVGHWLTVRLSEPDSYPAGIGARLELIVGGETLIRAVHAGDGYNGQNTYRIHFGMGSETHADRLRVRWPDGLWEEFDDLEWGKHYVVERGHISTASPSHVPTGPDQALADLDLKIWPNPTVDFIDVAVPAGSTQLLSLTVHDVLGREIQRFRTAFSGQGLTRRIDLSDVAPGVYLIRISDGRVIQQGIVVRR